MAEAYSAKEEQDKVSKINSAGLINITIENLWSDSYRALARSDYILWNRKLDAIWLILGADVEPNGKEEKKMDAINEKIYKTGSLNHKKIGFATIDEDEQVSMNQQYLLLMQKGLLLRRMQNAQGKGTAYATGDDQDWE